MKKFTSGLFSLFTLTGSLFGLNACSNTPSDHPPIKQDSMNTPPKKNDSIRPSYSSEDIGQMLKKLAETPVKQDLKIGAMCYSKVVPTDTSAYVCPVCGEKTIYQPREAATIRLEIPRCRSMVNFLPQTLELDETAFCKHCRPQGKNQPELCLKVHLTDAEEHISCGIRENDLEILLAFFTGQLTHTLDNGGEIPMQDEMDRIKRLLGIK